ncbi:hypothetical protein C8J57DRAFT_1269182 [Mycena rebaudengoi]|nr:hypothetical protein C8J57DRAFT_1269182 [Mycena rebaudengoi]
MRQALVRGQSLDSVLSDDSAVVDNAATHYAGAQGGKYRWLRKRFTPHGIVDRLLRKTVKRNTWIYVSVDHFHQFIDVLGERKVDMRKAKISKAEIALWGIEHIKKGEKKKGQAIASGKEKLHQVGDAAMLWKQEVLEGRFNPRSAGKSNHDGDNPQSKRDHDGLTAV